MTERYAKTQPWRVAKQRARRSNRIPPLAPSPREVRFYELIIKKAKANKKLPKRLLVLGATPEIRDSGIRNGFEAHAVDLSKEMMDKFSLLMKIKKGRLDIRIIKNWLEMDYPKNFFSVVVGDASLANLATRKENEKLVNILKKITAKSGYLALRQVVYPSNFKPIKSISKLISLYRKKKISWADFFAELRVHSFKKEVYNKKTYRYNAAKNFQLIDNLLRKNILKGNEYKKINAFRNDVINTFYPEKIFVQMVQKHGFKLIQTFKDKPHRFFNYMYIFVFRKV